MKVWDGTSETRSDPTVRRGPDGGDWKAITKELQATQEFVVNLAVNADAMPNLVKEVKARQDQLGSLQVAISKLEAPENLKLQMVELSVAVEELRSIYVHASEVLQTVNFLQRQLLNLGRRIDSHIEETKQNRSAFENQMTHRQRVNEKRWNDRLSKAEEQLGTISLALGLQKFGES